MVSISIIIKEGVLFYNDLSKQAGGELCKAHDKLGIAKPALPA